MLTGRRLRRGAPSAHPGRSRTWAGALFTFVALVSLPVLPTYGSRLRSCWTQVTMLPDRVRLSADGARRALLGEPFQVMARARDAMPEDAVILISDDPADRPLSSILWCAYYLYPRVLVQPSTLRDHPEITPDYVIFTPRFCGDRVEVQGLPHAGFLAVSERARRRAEERQAL